MIPLTLQDVVDYVNRKVINSETDANKVKDLNKIQLEIFTELGRLSNQTKVDVSVTTVSGTAEYTLPTGVRVEDIVRLDVETAASSAEYDEYEYAGINDEIDYRQVWQRGSVVTKFYLYDNEEAPDNTGSKIKITYYPRPASLSATSMSSQTPDLDPEYHNLLCYALCREMAAQGNDPQQALADYYTSMYDEFMKKVKASLSDRANDVFETERTAQEWW